MKWSGDKSPHAFFNPLRLHSHHFLTYSPPTSLGIVLFHLPCVILVYTLLSSHFLTSFLHSQALLGCWVWSQPLHIPFLHLWHKIALHTFTTLSYHTQEFLNSFVLFGSLIFVLHSTPVSLVLVIVGMISHCNPLLLWCLLSFQWLALGIQQVSSIAHFFFTFHACKKSN